MDRQFCKWLNNGSNVAWGKANREYRVDDDFARLIQMCRFDCARTLYKFCGQINRRTFGVPMGGYMSTMCQGSGLRRGVGSTKTRTLFSLAQSGGYIY